MMKAVLKTNYLHKFMEFKCNVCSNHGSKGIRQWSINLCTSQIIIHKISSTVDYNWWLKRLDTQLNEPTNKNSTKVPKVVNPTNKKILLYKNQV